MFRLPFTNLVSACAAFLMSALVGCTVPYPRCNNDDNCRGHKEVCVQGQCQQCRDDTHCAQGEHCSNNRCLTPGACNVQGDCGHDQNCVANKCVPAIECDTTRLCGDGKHCTEGRCLSEEEDDPSLRDNHGRSCTFETVYFGFDSAEIDTRGTTSLQSDADCLRREHDSRYVLIGRADPRGTTEYNLALGERRARAVQRYLVSLGVEPTRIVVSSEGSELATGTDDASWALDRRVDFRPRD